MTSLDTPSTNLSFQLAIPPSWTQIPLEPASRDSVIKAATEQRLADTPELVGLGEEIAGYIASVASEAWDHGARFCATFAEPAGDGLVMGSVTVSVLPPVKPSGRSSTADLLSQAETGQVDRSAGEWRLAEVIDLPSAGRAVRQWGVAAIAPREVADGKPYVFTNTFLPVEGAVLLVTCVSPAADLADPLLELFAHVSDSLVVGKADAVAGADEDLDSFDDGLADPPDQMATFDYSGNA